MMFIIYTNTCISNRCIKAYLFASLFVLMGFTTKAFAQQEYTWWNEKHNWDGHTHWSRMMRISPGYMGPNALPVPQMLDGRIPERNRSEIGFSSFHSPGEITLSSFGNVFYSIAQGLASFEVNHIFLEYYKTDTLLRDERIARSEHVEGWAVGDLSVTTTLALVKDRNWPDMVLRAGFRTTSGSKLSDARYTDAPGHYFDLSFGKNLWENEALNQNIRLFWSGGIYIWQISYPDNRQNDAILAGIGLSWNKGNHLLSAETTGYFGYRNERDQPVVQRIRYQYSFERIGLRVWYQKGLHDVYHHNLNISFVYFW